MNATSQSISAPPEALLSSYEDLRRTAVGPAFGASALRAVFERAQKFAPAIILFDEIDSIAPSRSAESAQHQVSTVAQLLVLLDGIEARGQIFVLATTNRPEHVDAALRRPGRFDQVVWMGLPDECGRADIFEHYLCGLKLDPRLTPDRLVDGLFNRQRSLAPRTVGGQPREIT